VSCRESCPHCETNYENDWHVFIGCEAAKQVWQVAGLWDIIMDAAAAVSNNFAECIFQLSCRCSKQMCQDIAMMLWCFWRRQNDKVWEGDKMCGWLCI